MVDKVISKIPEGLPNRDAIVNAANECGTRSKCHNIHRQKRLMFLMLIEKNFFSEAADPCDTAQMVFNCFHEKNVRNLSFNFFFNKI